MVRSTGHSTHIASEEVFGKLHRRAYFFVLLQGAGEINESNMEPKLGYHA